MKTRITIISLLAILSTSLWAGPMGTAFTYQGRLTEGADVANGLYDLKFILYDAAFGGNQVGNSLTNFAVSINEGLYQVTLDFGAAFTGEARWLAMGVRTNGSSDPFTMLSPRQELTPTPYAIMANTASNLLGTLPVAQVSGAVGTAQVATNAFSIIAGTGLSGGGTAPLNGSLTLTLADTATSANTPNTIVKRDASGNFSAQTLTLSGNLALPSTSGALTGAVTIGGSPMLHAFGTWNTFVGPGAGNFSMSGAGNTANGAYALYANTSGDNNTAHGVSAFYYNTSGVGNTANGAGALSNSFGSFNTADGFYALGVNGSGSYNIALGYLAGGSIVGGSSNIDIGNPGLLTDNNIIRIGSGQSQAFIAGVINGNGAGLTSLNAARLTSIGNTNGGYNNFFVGESGNSTMSGRNNTGNGTMALLCNTNGVNNTANGVAALYLNTSGSYNTADGMFALYYNTNGSDNTANGYSALFWNTSGSENTASGYGALGANTSGSYNTGSGTIALGNTTGSNNIALGYNAGSNITTGSSNIDIGNLGATGDNNIIRIGSGQAATYIAGISGVTISPSGGAVYINANGQLGTVNSSRRFKEAIQDMASQSDILLSLRPVAFHYKPELDPQATPQFGLIAEEVEQVAPHLVLRDAQGEVSSVRYEQINALLLNEFLKEHRKVEAQGTEIEDLKARLEKLENLLAQQNGGGQ